jgi:sec-independent protein translocase protein TatC
MLRRKDNPLPPPRAMTFGDHLEELRRRLLFAILMVLPIFLLSMVFGQQLVRLILAPAQAQLQEARLPGSFIVTNPVEAIGAYFRVAAVVTIVLGVPAILLQLWMFVSPGLYPHERRFALFLIPLSLLLSVIGLAFLYFIMLPAMLAFLINFGASMGQTQSPVVELPPGLVLPQMPVLEGDPGDPSPGAMWFNGKLEQLRMNAAPAGQPAMIVGAPMMRASGVAQQYRISEYVDLVFTMSLAFAIGFQTPVIVLLLGWMGIVSREMLLRKRKHAVLVAFVVAAVLTPSPDPLSMTMLAVPLYMLFELGLILLRVLPTSRLAGPAGAGREPPDAGDA